MQTYDEQSRWYPLHWTMLLFGLLGIIRGNILPLIFGFASQSTWLLFLIVGTGMVLPVIALVFKFFSMRYQMDEGHLRIREGIFSKKIRSIPVKRIHNINTRQSMLARIMKVTRLDIETAGGGSSEASFVALSFPAAQEIQDFVRMEKAKDPSEPDETVAVEEEDETPIYKIRMRDILIAGATTNRIGVILVAAGFLFQYVDEFSGDIGPDWIQAITEYATMVSSSSPVQLILMSILGLAGLFLLAWLISIATALVRWHRFTLLDRGEDLRIRTGLFTLREFTMPRDKIQALRVITTPFRRPFGLSEVRVQSAGHIGMQDTRMESDLLAPISPVEEVGTFTQAVWSHADWDDVDWMPVHPYTRLRQFRILLMILTVISLALFFSGGVEAIGAVLSAVLALIFASLAWVISHLTYKQTAYAQDDHFIYVKTGFLGLHFWVIPIGKVQNLEISQNPWQRLRGLVSLHLDVAGSAFGRQPVIPNIELAKAWPLFNRFAHPQGLMGRAITPETGIQS